MGSAHGGSVSPPPPSRSSSGYDPPLQLFERWVLEDGVEVRGRVNTARREDRGPVRRREQGSAGLHVSGRVRRRPPQCGRAHQLRRRDPRVHRSAARSPRARGELARAVERCPKLELAGERTGRVSGASGSPDVGCVHLTAGDSGGTPEPPVRCAADPRWADPDRLHCRAACSTSAPASARPDCARSSTSPSSRSARRSAPSTFGRSEDERFDILPAPDVRARLPALVR